MRQTTPQPSDDARRMYRRAAARWACTLLTLRSRGLLRPTAVGRAVVRRQSDGLTLAATAQRAA